MAKRYRHGELTLAERMRLESKMAPYLMYAEDDEDEEEPIGLRDDAPEDVKDFYARKQWEAEEVARTGVIVD